MTSKEQTLNNDKRSAKLRLPKPANEGFDIVVQRQPHPATIIQRAKLDPRLLSARDVLQLQRTIGSQAVSRLLTKHSRHQSIQQKENHTGLPDNLKSRIASLSGYSLDDVRVHYYSDKPAQLNAHVYAQRTDISSGSGQERHLPYEAWHVVKQKQERVKPILQIKDKLRDNDDNALEKETDVMGNLVSRYNPRKENVLPEQSLQRIPHICRVQLQVTHRLVSQSNSSSGDRVIQAKRGARLVTGLGEAYVRGEPDRAVLYLYGWVADLIDAYLSGHIYDFIQLIYGVTGGHGAGILARAEEVLRFIQHHPEIAQWIPIYQPAIPIIANYFGVPTWVVYLIISRGSAADAIGSYLTSFIPAQFRSFVPVRRIGRSVLDRGTAVMHSIASCLPGGGQVISGISRILHGYSLNTGSIVEGPNLPTPGSLGQLYSMLSDIMPMERLHILPNRRGGHINMENAVYGSAAANSMMIPLENRNFPAMAIQSPTNQLEAMTMIMGLFRVRGIRPREGEIEHIFAKIGFA